MLNTILECSEKYANFSAAFMPNYFAINWSGCKSRAVTMRTNVCFTFVFGRKIYKKTEGQTTRVERVTYQSLRHPSSCCNFVFDIYRSRLLSLIVDWTPSANLCAVHVSNTAYVSVWSVRSWIYSQHLQQIHVPSHEGFAHGNERREIACAE